MEYIIEITKEFLFNYGALAIFLVGFLEEVFFIIPSSVVFLATGFLVVDPGISFISALIQVIFGLAIWGALGATLGSYIIYGIFYWGGKKVLAKYGKYLGLSWNEVEKFERRLKKGNTQELSITIFRALPIWSIAVVSAVCGILRINWKTFGIYTFLGTIIRIMILAMIGWKIGDAYDQLSSQLEIWEKFGTTALLVLIVSVFIYFYRRKGYKKKEEKTLEDGE